MKYDTPRRWNHMRSAARYRATYRALSIDMVWYCYFDKLHVSPENMQRWGLGTGRIAFSGKPCKILGRFSQSEGPKGALKHRPPAASSRPTLRKRCRTSTSVDCAFLKWQWRSAEGRPLSVMLGEEQRTIFSPTAHAWRAEEEIRGKTGFPCRISKTLRVSF